jgi:hypothetical protein
MVIFKDTRRFELTVDEYDGEWLARLQEVVPGRPCVTLHLLRTFGTRQVAIDALIRKWHVLFPDDAALVWRDPPPVPSLPQPHSPAQRP